MSSTSSTSTRSSMTKNSSSSTNLTSQTSNSSSQRISKRSLSPSIVISLQRAAPKRRRGRQPKVKHPTAVTASSSAIIIKIDDDDEIEQENDDDDEIIPIKIEPARQSRPGKQRQDSSGSIEYVQALDTDAQAPSSLNNIENIKSKAKINDEEIIICRSPPSVTKVISSQTKNRSKAPINGGTTRKSASQQVRIDQQNRAEITDSYVCCSPFSHPTMKNMFVSVVKSAVKFSKDAVVSLNM